MRMDRYAVIRVPRGGADNSMAHVGRNTHDAVQSPVVSNGPTPQVFRCAAWPAHSTGPNARSDAGARSRTAPFSQKLSVGGSVGGGQQEFLRVGGHGHGLDADG